MSFMQNTSFCVALIHSAGENEKFCEGLASHPVGEFILHGNQGTDLYESALVKKLMFTFTIVSCQGKIPLRYGNTVLSNVKISFYGNMLTKNLSLIQLFLFHHMNGLRLLKMVIK